MIRQKYLKKFFSHEQLIYLGNIKGYLNNSDMVFIDMNIRVLPFLANIFLKTYFILDKTVHHFRLYNQ